MNENNWYVSYPKVLIDMRNLFKYINEFKKQIIYNDDGTINTDETVAEVKDLILSTDLTIVVSTAFMDILIDCNYNMHKTKIEFRNKINNEEFISDCAIRMFRWNDKVYIKTVLRDSFHMLYLYTFGTKKEKEHVNV